MKKYMKIHENDTAAVALVPLKKGEKADIDGRVVTLTEDIPQGHKFAATSIAEGNSVIKYGCSIGRASADIPEGAWIHTHNLKTGLGNILTYSYDRRETSLPPSDMAYFKGYRRSDGSVGVRNEIWIIPTVGCVNSVVREIEKRSQDFVHGSVEGIFSFNHQFFFYDMGCYDFYTRKILADLVNHPNAGGVLMLGLGCENSGIDEIKKFIGDYDERRVKFLVAQECEDEISDAVEIIKDLADYVGSFQREDIPASELIVGLKCGGSDGLSGITANPAVGRFSDILVSKGGTTVLTEVPEMFGAETLLMNRCENEDIFKQTVSLINDFKNYFTSHGQTIYENPSPGNKKGGISTLEEKSLGCTQKSGSSAVRGVLKYGERVSEGGLNLLSAPGNDLVASTALAASGAHIVLFTTGRGTPFASPVPTVKISTNTSLSEKKHDWIDFDCGAMVNDKSLSETGEELFEFVLNVASGKKVKSEEKGYHDMAIFKDGVTL